MRYGVEHAQGQAVLLMVLSSFLISIGDALVNGLGNQISVWQLYVMRATVAVPLLLGIIGLRRGVSLRVHRLGWLVLRSLLMVAMWGLFYAALPSIGLAMASAGLYTFPLFLLLFSWLGGLQPLRLQAVAALVLGFGGTLLVVQPGSGHFSAASLLPLGAAICYALQALVTRYRCRQESPWMLALGMNVGFPVMGGLALGLIPAEPPASNHNPSLAFLVGGWHAVGVEIWGVATLLAIIIIGGSASMAMAYQKGDPPTIATFDYSHLLFAVIWGRLFFDERVGTPTLIGMMTIAVAGAIILLRPNTATRHAAYAAG